ncbi:hypothetical protein NEFER01_0912 [Nematocida sp. LUAm1]|nr:hypothetical protein NEFER02_1284 [Nematocida sp. LUAm2]KAI5177688.1 hypothetical protein NEFER01_0912 [Nematocida sp. LUAm1]
METRYNAIPCIADNAISSGTWSEDSFVSKDENNIDLPAKSNVEEPSIDIVNTLREIVKNTILSTEYYVYIDDKDESFVKYNIHFSSIKKTNREHKSIDDASVKNIRLFKSIWFRHDDTQAIEPLFAVLKEFKGFLAGFEVFAFGYGESYIKIVPKFTDAFINTSEPTNSTSINNSSSETLQPICQTHNIIPRLVPDFKSPTKNTNERLANPNIALIKSSIGFKLSKYSPVDISAPTLAAPSYTETSTIQMENPNAYPKEERTEYHPNDNEPLQYIREFKQLFKYIEIPSIVFNSIIVISFFFGFFTILLGPTFVALLGPTIMIALLALTNLLRIWESEIHLVYSNVIYIIWTSLLISQLFSQFSYIRPYNSLFLAIEWTYIVFSGIFSYICLRCMRQSYFVHWVKRGILVGLISTEIAVTIIYLVHVNSLLDIFPNFTIRHNTSFYLSYLLYISYNIRVYCPPIYNSKGKKILYKYANLAILLIFALCVCIQLICVLHKNTFTSIWVRSVIHLKNKLLSVTN